MPNRPIVGPKAFSTFVQQMRDAYPDLAYEVEQVCGAVLCAGFEPRPAGWLQCVR
jgi:hypothetical protein